jgi:hypothetical protein
VGRVLFATVEILLFSALILATRCANYRDVFVGGEIYFTDADCYSRMTRVRTCLENPGIILRHHSFENYPTGTTPHTTAPLDYLIATLAGVMKLITSRALDLAGAIVSPLMALVTGWFLWWWSRWSQLQYRGALLLLYAVSPILVHGAELGRPDHQSLLIGLIAVALCAEWSLTLASLKPVGAPRSFLHWSLVSGVAWGLALWVSFYEPLILLGVLVISQALFARQSFTASHRLAGWAVCAGIVLLALAIEQRLPAWPGAGAYPIFANWARTIGELSPVAVDDRTWFRWTGLLLIALPALLWIAMTKLRSLPHFLTALLIASFALTLWQARWAYFFVMIFALALPALLTVFRNQIAGWIVFVISLFPVLSEWDEKLWPNERQNALLLERRAEAVGWRQAAREIAPSGEAPFLAPWWWSPAVTYWSGQPGVAGSSHGALAGIERSARFFLATNPDEATELLLKTKAAWVIAYDAERMVANSAALLGVPPPENALAHVLDRTPAHAPSFLQLVSQNAACKLFRVRIFQEKEDFPR